MKTIGVVTVARSDFGIYLPVLKRIQSQADLSLRLYAGGTHLSPEFGCTARLIEEAGFEIAERIEMLLSSDTPEGIAKSMGLGTIAFAQSFARCRPDILLVLGDRFEMHASVIAALPFKIPVAHIHGGESTEGAIDDALRHSITKMSHLHFVAAESYRQRVIQMGEDPARVITSGAPALDNLRAMTLLNRRELEERYQLKLDEPFLLATYHPVTLEYEQTEARVNEFLSALEESSAAVVFTYPNADTGSRQIIQMIKEHVKRNDRAQITVNLGTQGYLSIMQLAAAMVGNSSSGIIEAASFRLPVVNIGNRQRGRLRARNVIDAGDSHAEIITAISRALVSDFRNSLVDLVNPYGDGHAAERIVETLRAIDLNDTLLMKHFHEM